LEPDYPESVVFYFLFQKFMLVELILAAGTECGMTYIFLMQSLAVVMFRFFIIVCCFSGFHILKSE